MLLGHQATRLLLASAITVATVCAQRIHTRIYDVADGLPNRSVHGITQDADGCMWFTTRAGIVCYDGLEWTRSGPPGGMGFGRAAIDDGGDIWSFALDEPHHPVRLQNTRWVEYPVTVGLPEHGGIGGVGIRGSGDDTQLLIACVRGNLLFWDGDRWLDVSGDRSLRFSNVTRVGDIFHLSTDRGLFTFDPSRPNARLLPIVAVPDESVYGTAIDPATDREWVIGPTWIGEYERGDFRFITRDMPFRASAKQDYHVTADGNGGVYFGDMLGLHHFIPFEGVRLVDRAEGLSAGGTTALFRDREGIVWNGSLRGVTKVLSRRFSNYTTAQGLAADEVTLVRELKDGSILLGHPEGIAFFHGRNDPIRIGSHPIQSRVLDCSEANDGTIWVAGNHDGLFRYARGERTAERVELPVGATEAVHAVHAASDGTILASVGRDLLRLRNGRWTPVDIPDHSERTFGIRRILEDDEGAIVLGTAFGGVMRMHGREVRHWHHAEDHNANNVFAVSLRPDGAIWAGTASGLCRCTPNGSLEPVLTPRIVRPTYFILDDADGNTWYGTDNGVYRHRGDEVRHFSVRDGLAGSETNRAAAICDREGHIWIGTDRGLSVFDPRHDRRPSHPPTVAITDIEAGGSRRLFTGELELPHDHNTVVFRFRTISFADEERVLHRTKLEGFDRSWSEARPLPTRELRYTSLPPGAYRMHVEVIDVDGVASGVVTSPAIHIANPFWRQSWVLITATIIVLIVIGGAFKFVSQRRYARRLESSVLQRTADLEAEKARLEATLSSIGDGLVVLDDACNVALWNRAAQKITGYSESDAIGRPLHELFTLPSTDVTDTAAGPVVLKTPTGIIRQLEFSSAPLGMQVESGRVLAFRDITDRRRVERNLARNERLDALGLLAGGIAHDFNNLLTVVLGNLSLIRLTDSSQHVEPRVRAAESATKQARALTQQLLTFSRAGDPIRRVASLHELLTESAKFLLSGANVRCDLELEDGLWPVEIDTGQVSQVVHNLLINARQAMPEGGRIVVRAHNLEVAPASMPEGPAVVIEVEDNGVGIAPDALDRVFDPYFSTKPGGSGLGLSTSYSIVSRHDGILMAESDPGQCTIFRAYLPASPQASVASESDSDPALTAAKDEGETPARVLVMDDEEPIRVLLKSMLTQLGHHCTTTGDGGAAIAMYRQALDTGQRFDLVIADLTVPGGMGGRVTLEHLKLIDDEVSAVAISGYSNDPVMADPREYGFRKGIAKPFGIDELETTLREVLSRASPKT